MTLAGQGTVLAQQSQVNWDVFESCEGMIPALQDDNLTPTKARRIIKTWNQRICKSEVTTKAGDLVVMKGRKLTSRPCLHRAPYCAGEGMQPIRLLITLDHIPQDELQLLIDMAMDDAVSDYSDSDDAYSDDANQKAVAKRKAAKTRSAAYRSYFKKPAASRVAAPKKMGAAAKAGKARPGMKRKAAQMS